MRSNPATVAARVKGVLGNSPRIAVSSASRETRSMPPAVIQGTRGCLAALARDC